MFVLVLPVTLMVRCPVTKSEVLAPRIITNTKKSPDELKVCVVLQLPPGDETTANRKSLKPKMHLNGAVPPVNVAVKVTASPTLEVWGVAVKLVSTSGGMENVYVRTEPDSIPNVLG